MNRKSSIKKENCPESPIILQGKMKKKSATTAGKGGGTHESAVYTVSTQYDFKDNPKPNSIGQSQEHISD